MVYAIRETGGGDPVTEDWGMPDPGRREEMFRTEEIKKNMMCCRMLYSRASSMAGAFDCCLNVRERK